MKLSKNTFDHLQHFSKINPNFLFKKGAEQTTIACSKNRLVMATLDTSFPTNFPIRDLSEFLKAVTSFSDPDIEFTKNKLIISENNEKIYFRPSNLKSLVLPGTGVKFPKTDYQFDIDRTQFLNLITAIKKHRLNYIFFNSDRKNLTITSDPTYRGSYVYEQFLGKIKDTFSFRFRAESLVCPIDDYEVSICTKGIARFQSKNCDYISYVAIENHKT